MKKLIKYIIFFISFFLFVKITNYLTRNSDEKFVIKDIKLELTGQIIKKVDIRKGLFTHLKIRRNKQADTVIFAGGFIDHSSVGDLIVKKKNTPYCFVVSKGIKRKYPFTLIPKKMIHNENFPPAWRDSCKTAWKR